VGGPEVMRRQLQHLKHVAGTEKNVTLEIVPLRRAPIRAWRGR
jgi:hypothetical protein